MLNEFPQIPNLSYGKVLGVGSYAVVVETTDKATGKEYAMKIIDKTKSAHKLHHIHQEIEILKRLKHEHIITLHQVFDTPAKTCLLIERVQGSDLIKVLKQRKLYTENDARKLIFEIVGAIKYLHSLDIVHRDLKPENILVSGEDDSIKIADFGLAADVSNNKLLSTLCGSLYYLAPEVISTDNYDGKTCDMWAIGVISYLLLTGKVPFDGPNSTSIMVGICDGNCEYDPDDWSNISVEGMTCLGCGLIVARDFVQALLVVKPEDRLTATQAYEHLFLRSEFLKNENPALYRALSALTSQNLSISIGENLKQHSNKRSLSRAWEKVRDLGMRVRSISSTLKFVVAGASRPTTPSGDKTDFPWDNQYRSQSISRSSVGSSRESTDKSKSTSNDNELPGLTGSGSQDATKSHNSQSGSNSNSTTGSTVKLKVPSRRASYGGGLAITESPQPHPLTDRRRRLSSQRRKPEKEKDNFQLTENSNE